MPSTRTNDPETSHLAERSVSDVTEKQDAVYEVLKVFGPLTDKDLIQIYGEAVNECGLCPQSDSGLRTRRKELVDKGIVEWTGQKIKDGTRRLSRTWKVTNG
jgi:uncharacterized protein (DUF2225 family)